jgi:hypothetical protein
VRELHKDSTAGHVFTCVRGDLRAIIFGPVHQTFADHYPVVVTVDKKEHGNAWMIHGEMMREGPAH